MTAAGECGAPLPPVTVALACGPEIAAVERSLRSIRAQTVWPFEVVAVNLGCPETALTAPAGVEGLAAAWNRAATGSSARYICFLESGDEIEETWIERCLFHLEVSSLDVCGSWQARGPLPHRPRPFSLRTLLAGEVTGFAVMRRETLVRAGGFDRAVEPRFSILDLCIRMAEAGARGRMLPGPPRRHPAEPGAGDASAAFVARRCAHLLNDARLVERLDADRSAKARLGSYAGLLGGARPAGPPAILVATPFLAMGGAERALAGLLGELSRGGFRVFLVTTEVAPPELGDTGDWFRGQVAGLYRLPRFIAPNLRLAFLSYLIQRHSIQSLLQVGSPSLYRWLPRLKELFPSLAVVDLLFNPVGHTGSYSKHRELIDRVVVEHEGMAAWLTGRGERRNRISVIPNAVDTARFAPRPPRERRTGEPPRTDAFVVGFFGRLAREKAPDTFLRIAERFRDRPSFQFLIGGTGPLEPALRALCERCGLEETVRFLGFVDTREYIPRCHVTVTCSRIDGRPNVILESLAMGVPVVASRVGGIPEMLPEGHGGLLCEPGDVAGFRAAIERLASDRDEYLRLAAAGPRWVAAQYSLERAAGEYAKLFHALAGAHPWPVRTAVEEAAIAAATLPPVRQYRPLPPRRWCASLCILRQALSWPNAPGTLRTAWLYARLPRDPARGNRLAGFFDPAYYALCRPDVAAAHVSPLWHYLLAGFREGANPSVLFNTDYYLETQPDIAGAGINPLVHYLAAGLAEGRDCVSPWD